MLFRSTTCCLWHRHIPDQAIVFDIVLGPPSPGGLFFKGPDAGAQPFFSYFSNLKIIPGMKTLRLSLILFLLLSTKAWAGSFSLTPQVGYFFSERFPVDNGQVTIKPGFFVGGIASYSFSDAIDIELQYSRRNSPLDIKQGDSTRSLDMTTGWLLVNGCYTFENDAPAQPFLAVGMGWVRLDPKETKIGRAHV